MVYVLFTITITITIISHHYCSLIFNPQTRPPLSPNSYTFLGGRPLVHRAGEKSRDRTTSTLQKKPRTHHPINITIFLPSHIPHPPIPHLNPPKIIPNHAALLHNLLLQRRRRNRKNSPRNSRLGDYCDWILSTDATYAYAYAYAGARTDDTRTDGNVD